MGINLFEITDIDPADPEVIAAGEDFDDFANLITSLVSTRKDRGLSQKKIAAIMGTKQSVVSDLERVGGNPTIRTIQRYARAVGCRVRFAPLDTAPLK
jgi:ribosome-binding protein aMBF1 (putative translation factor)